MSITVIAHEIRAIAKIDKNILEHFIQGTQPARGMQKNIDQEILLRLIILKHLREDFTRQQVQDVEERDINRIRNHH